jgi:arylsulfatase
MNAQLFFRTNWPALRRLVAVGMAALLFAAILSFLTCGVVSEQTRPNIIVIMVDDMGYSDLGCYGSEIATPNIDRLAQNGLRFTQFYNAARCCPTRASLLTGLYPHQAGMGGMIVREPDPARPPSYQGYLNDRCVTIAEVLREAGYTTLMSGKWHVGEFRPHWPVDRGFERYFGIISGGGNYFDISKGKAPGIKRIMANDGEPYTPPEQGFYMTDAITDSAVSMLQSHERSENPFFLYVAYTAPHWPLHALPEDIEKYVGKYRGGWQKLRNERYRRMLDIGIIDSQWPLSPLDGGAIPWEQVEDKEDMDRRMAVYAAQIDRADQGIGKILAEVHEMGQEDNTLILFLSDNGGCHEGGALGFDRRNNGLPAGGVDSYMSYGRSWSNASNTPFRMHKHWTHEGGIATPLIAYWPSVIKQKGAITRQVGHVIDIMATCADLARATYPQTVKGKPTSALQGKSLVPILKGEEREPHVYMFWEHMGNRAVRHGKWKLVSKEGNTWELYDLEADRSELHDLADENPDMMEQLIQQYHEWASEVGVRERGT